MSQITELGTLDCLCEVLNRLSEVAVRLDERCRFGVRDEIRISTLRARLDRGMKQANDLFAQLPSPGSEPLAMGLPLGFDTGQVVGKLDSATGKVSYSGPVLVNSPQRAGGLARAASMTPERRSEVAREAARRRWGVTDTGGRQ